MPHFTELYRIEHEQEEERKANMGVSTHSQPKTLAIISAQTGETLNLNVHRLLLNDIAKEGGTSTVVTGSFQSRFEHSLLVEGLEDEVLTRLARKYGQKCWLKLENHKHGTYKATLMHSNYKPEPIGYMRSMDIATIEALGLDYTFRPDTNTYFTVWPSDTTIMQDFDAEIKAALAGKMGRVMP